MKKETILQLITYLTMVAFLMIHIFQNNFEFINYIIVALIVYWIILYTHKKTNFPFIILVGFSVWLFLHLLGGTDINGIRTYARILIDITGAPYYLIRYDQFLHVYIYVVFGGLLYFALKKNVKKMTNGILLVAVLGASGIGALNEIFEFFLFTVLPSTGVGDYVNNAIDLVANTIGAIIGVALSHYYAQKKQ